jgi:hypothetical protein
MPVWCSFVNTTAFNSYQYGINQGTVYWVASASAGNIQLSKTYADSLTATNLQTFTAGGAGNLYLNTGGYAGLELNGITGSIVNAQILQIDLELDCTVAIQAQNTNFCELHWFNLPGPSATTPPTLPSVHVSIVERTCVGNVHHSHAIANYDFDSIYSQWFGYRMNLTDPAAGINVAPTGITGGALFLNGKQNDATADIQGTGQDGVRFNSGVNYPTTTFSASGNVADGINIFTGATAGQTLTLKTPTSNMLGGESEIINLGSVSISVVITGGLLFNGKAALTTITMLANSAAKFRKVYNGTAYGYAIVGFSGSYSAGTITGV